MKLKIFHDDACDYILSWVVCDIDVVDKMYLDIWKQRGKDMSKNLYAYERIATFSSKQLAEEYIKFKQGGK